MNIIYYYPTPNSTLVGNIDAINENGLLGWVFDHANQERTVEILVFIDNRCYGTFFADFYREDLETAGYYGNGKHGFYVAFPSVLRDDQEHTITVKTQCGCVISPSPQKCFMSSMKIVSNLSVIENKPIDDVMYSLIGTKNFLVFTGTAQPFSDAIYIWERNFGLVMTLQRSYPARPDVDLRGMGGNWSETGRINWEPEFFCESEGFISIISPDLVTHVDLNKFVFSCDWTVQNDSYAAIQSKSDHVSPTFFATLDDNHRRTIAAIKTIEITNNLQAGMNFVETRVNIDIDDSNLFQNSKICYTYQDAAYLSFRRANQNGVIPFSFITSNDGVIIRDIFFGYFVSNSSPDHRVYVGYYDLNNGVFSLLHCFEKNTLVGVIDHYLDSKEINHLHNHYVDIQLELFSSIASSGSKMKVLFVSHCFEYPYNQRLAIKYYRYGYYNQGKPFDNIEDVKQKIRQMHLH